MSQQITRRTLIAGTSAAAGLSVLGLTPAAAGTSPFATVGQDVAALTPAAHTPGLSYQYKAGLDASAFLTPITIDNEGNAYATAPGLVGSMLLAFSVPAGSRIKEAAIAIAFTAPGTVLYTLFRAGLADAVSLSGAIALPLTASSAGYRIGTAAFDEVVPADTTYAIYVGDATAASALRWARVGYVPATRQFVPINPVRVYDSRFDNAGKMALNATRTISVANQVVQQGGATNVVPNGAAAIAYNLTLANTEGSFGYLSVYPQDLADSLENYGSAINWAAAGVSIANGLNVAIAPNRQVKVSCGGAAGARTDFLIDVTGYYL